MVASRPRTINVDVDAPGDFKALSKGAICPEKAHSYQRVNIQTSYRKCLLVPCLRPANEELLHVGKMKISSYFGVVYWTLGV